MLMTALWLLLLCGTFVALIMLHGQQQSVSVRTAAALAQARFDTDAAIDSVVADILIKGGASSWSRLPASGSVQIGHHAVQLSISSENGRLDLNSADIDVIARALLGQVNAAQRMGFLAALQRARASGSRIEGPADAGRLLAFLSSKSCLDDWFTTYSGQSQPEIGSAPVGLAGSLNAGSDQRGDSVTRVGQSLRIDVKALSGPPVRVTIRLVGRQDRSFDTLSWTIPVACNAQ